MDEYIKREAVLESVREKLRISEALPDSIAKRASVFTLASMNDSLKSIPAADVRPVVTCERCVYHVDCGYHYCNKWCVNCPDDADFFCTYGEEES